MGEEETRLQEVELTVFLCEEPAMPSPFPGMDPYIEDPFFWTDFHGSMMGIIREAMNDVLPPHYVASMDRHVWIQEQGDEEVAHLGVPDVQVAERVEQSSAATALAVAAPTTIVLPVMRTQWNRFLKILDRHHRSIVTVIELLSPANKTASGYGIAYRQKRWDYLSSDVNLVEIDLLRSGERPPLKEPPPAASDYYYMVCASGNFPQAGFWPISVRDPLPPVPIPLKPGETPVYLNLRNCLERAYDGGRYSLEIDYSVPPKPPLTEPDATWARELITRTLSKP